MYDEATEQRFSFKTHIDAQKATFFEITTKEKMSRGRG